MSRTRLAIGLPLVASFSALLADPSLAQQPPRVNAPVEVAEGTDARGGQWDPRAVVSLSFTGGRVADYIEALRKAAGGYAVNVSFRDNTGRAEMPPVSFRSVPIEVAISAVSQLAEPGSDGAIFVREISSGAALPNQPAMPNMMRIGAPMFVIGIDTGPSHRAQNSRVLSLNRVIGGEGNHLSAEAVLTAIEAALRNDAKNMDIKFHPDTGLLFITGSPRQCQVAEEVVDKLAHDAASRRRGSGKPLSEKLSLAHVDAATLADAIRMAFPTPPNQPPEVTVSAVPQENAVLIAAPEDLMTAARALVRYADTKPETSPAMLELRSAQMDAQRQADRARKEYIELESRMQIQMAEYKKVYVDAEANRTRLELLTQELDRTRDRLEKQLAETKATLSERNQLIQSLAKQCEDLQAALRNAKDEAAAHKAAATPR